MSILKNFQKNKWFVRYQVYLAILFIIVLLFWTIIIPSELGGFIVFFFFGIHLLSKINLFNFFIILLFLVYVLFKVIEVKKHSGRKKKFPKLFFIFLILIIPQFLHTRQYKPPPKMNQELWECSMRTDFNRTIDLFESFTPTLGYKERQSLYLNHTINSDHVYAQAARVYQGLNITERGKISIEASLYKIYNFEDCLDFTLNSLVRLIYLDINKNILSLEIKNKVYDAFRKTKYWYTEPNRDNMIYSTENHQILFHTAELLIGQLFPNDTFVNSGITGIEHVNHALPLIKRWLDWRAEFGFAEWHSITYYVEDIAALVNLVDFSEDPEIVYKAAMVLDIIAFSFANNYYKSRYATTHGRCYDHSKVGKSELSPASRDSTTESTWIMLGIGNHEPTDINNLAAIALATSRCYAPPPILEDIANDVLLYNEHKERNSINMNDGSVYNLSYNEDDLMFWMGMSANLAPQTIKEIFRWVDKYKINPNTIYGPELVADFFKISSFLHGVSLNEYSEKLKLFTQGVCLETSNTYTYRTPYYQLSGAQDHQKGMNSFQQHIWQATLDDNAFVYTNSPGGLTKDFSQEYVGGWSPRATLYKNVGIIQYDRKTLPLEGELLLYFYNLFSDNRFYTHAYFPRWAFDEVQQHGKWTFGAKGDGYIALYSYRPTRWASNYELRVDGYKNVWLVEMGSFEDHGSFNQFISAIQDSQIRITPRSLGYEVYYNSPSQGILDVSWDSPMYINGSEIDLGPYPRFDNEYCFQDFGSKTTIIEFNNQKLVLDFDNYSRTYYNLT